MFNLFLRTMIKKLFLIPFLYVASCSPADDESLYCWECHSRQGEDSWTEDFHEWTELEIDDLVEDDLRYETPPIYTTCRKFSCYDHFHY